MQTPPPLRAARALSTIFTLLVLLLGSHRSALGQMVETLGSTAHAATDTGRAKGNAFRVDRSVLLESFEFFLSFQGPQTLEFHLHRGHSEIGDYERVATASVASQGVGPAWYSSGRLDLPLVCGNYYLLSVSWPGSMSYYFSVARSVPVSFGEFRTSLASFGHPLPRFVNTIGDLAVFHMRLTTWPRTSNDANVSCIAASCSRNALLPLLQTANRFPDLGATDLELELHRAEPSDVVLFLVAAAPAASPIVWRPACSLLLDPAAGLMTAARRSANLLGIARLRLAVPNQPSLRGGSVWSQVLAAPANASEIAGSNALGFWLW